MTAINIQGTKIIDLSHTISPDIPVPVGFPAPQLEMFLSQEAGDIANVEILTMGLHAGTHVDVPYHFFSGGRRVHELPVDCLIGTAVVVDLTGMQGSVTIEDEDLKEWEAASGEAIRSGDIILLHTGHSRNWINGEGASAYWERGRPHLARSAVEYLASKPIKAIGVESFDPDWVDLNNLAAAEFPAHRSFLPKGILVMENLTNLDQIPGSRCTVIALPLKIQGASGSPVRVIAIA